MAKLFKFYIMIACAALYMSGCGKTREALTEDIAATENQEISEENETEEPIETEEIVKEILHPVIEDGIDYLSIEGIHLEPGMEIAMVGTDSGNAFYEAVKKGAVSAVSDLNKALGYTGKNKLTLSYAAPKTEDVIDQINIIDQFLDKAPDALCIAFADATACKTQMQMAENNGIKQIAFDTPDESKAAEALVASDNLAASKEAASKLFDAVEDEGKIAILVHNSQEKTGQDRYQAIIDELEENYADKNLQIAEVVYLAQDERTYDEILAGLLEEHEDLAGIICTNLTTTEKTVDYVKNLEEQNFVIVGFDLSEKIVNAVSDGTLLGTVAQDPYHMGYATIVAAARSIAGLDNADSIHTAHLWVDSSNLDSEEVRSLLNY